MANSAEPNFTGLLPSTASLPRQGLDAGNTGTGGGSTGTYENGGGKVAGTFLPLPRIQSFEEEGRSGVGAGVTNAQARFGVNDVVVPPVANTNGPSNDQTRKYLAGVNKNQTGYTVPPRTS